MKHSNYQSDAPQTSLANSNIRFGLEESPRGWTSLMRSKLSAYVHKANLYG
jgi:hypothetical protein